MKNNFKTILCHTLLLASIFTYASPVVGVYAESSVNTTITVDEGNIIKPSDKMLLGVNDGWGESVFVYNDSTDIRKEYVDTFKEDGLKISFSRMAGYESQTFFWKGSIGTYDERMCFDSNRLGLRHNCGLLEWLTYTRMTNKDAKFDFAVNVRANPEDNADLVRFLCLDPSDPNAIGSDGTNWAQKRVDLGFEEKVIPVFELGNEFDYGTYSDQALLTAKADEYIDYCRANMEAMTAVKSDIDFAPLMFTLPHSTPDGPSNALYWNQRIINEFCGECKYIAFHYYYTGGSGADLEVTRLKNQITDFIDVLPLAQQPKIIITEHAVWAASDAPEESKVAISSLRGTLKTAQVLNIVTNDRHVAGACYHCMDGGTITEQAHGQWHIISKHKEDGNYYISGIGELLKTLSYAFGDGKTGENVVKTTLSGNQYVSSNNTRERFTASAHTTADGGLNLVMVNNDASTHTHNITFSANNNYKLEKEYILTASDDLSDNRPSTPEAIYPVCNLVNSQSRFSTYTVAPNSVVVLKLVPISKQATSDKSLEISVDNADMDANGHFTVSPKENKIGISAQVFANKSLHGAEALSLLVLKPDSDMGGLDPFSDDVCYMTDVKVKKGYAYFEVPMPSEAGEYTAVVSGEGANGITSENITFTYNPNLKSKYVRAVSVEGDYVGDIVKVSNKDYLVSCNVSFAKGSAIGSKYSISVISEANGNTIYSDLLDYPGEGIQNITFKLPKDCIEGLYKVSVSFADDLKPSENVFYLEKASEKFTFSDLVKSNENVVTIDTLQTTENLDVKIKNEQNNNVQAKILIAAYDDTGRLLKTSTADEIFAADEEKNISIPFNSETLNVNAIKIFVWDKADGIPYTEVYRLR